MAAAARGGHPVGLRALRGHRDGRGRRRHLARAVGARMSMVFQDPMTSLNPVMRIGRQIAEPLELHMGMDRKEAKATTIELLTQVGIPSPPSGRRPTRASSPAACASASSWRLHSPAPPSAHGRRATTGLDVTVQAQILDLLGSLQAERHMAVISSPTTSASWPLVPTRSPSCMRSHRREGTDQDTLRRHGHAYTAALLASTPRLSEPSHSRLAAIDGRPPTCSTRPGLCLRTALCLCAGSLPGRAPAPGRGRRAWPLLRLLVPARWPRASRRPGEPDQRPAGSEAL